jgi:membrane AbrB-like protein
VRRLLPWLLVAAIVALAGWGLDVVGVPSPWLFGALLLGLAIALAAPGRLAVPEPGFTAAQAVTGVTLGTYLQSSALSALGHDWLAVALVSAATLGISLVAGLGLAKVTSLDAPTAALGMIAGGASGIVPMARALDGDDRLVAFMQYVRVLVVVLLTPLLIPILFPGHHGASAASAGSGGPILGTPAHWLLTLAIAWAAGWAALRLRMPAGALLGPMIVAGAITLSGLASSLVVPPVLREAAFAVIGLQVGLRFTVETVRQVGRLLIPVLLCVLFLLVACFGLAAVLAATTSVTLQDAYLATTPGGLYAVLAVAFGAGANTTFIVAVQGLRVLVMVLLAPVAVRLILRRPLAVARQPVSEATTRRGRMST